MSGDARAASGEAACAKTTQRTTTHHIVGLLDLRRDLGELFPAGLCVLLAGGEGGISKSARSSLSPTRDASPRSLSLSPPVSAASPVICRLISVDFWQYSFSYCENSAPSSMVVRWGPGRGRGRGGWDALLVSLALTAPRPRDARRRRARRDAAARRRRTLGASVRGACARVCGEGARKTRSSSSSTCRVERGRLGGREVMRRRVCEGECCERCGRACVV